jgi:regulation of enolase protein 1 (concanavalin A-like superfamily)
MRGVKLTRVTMGVLWLLICVANQTANAQYVHPGGLHTQADLDRMKTQVAAGAHPWIDDWNLLIVDPLAQKTYTAAPRANMGANRQRADQDAHAAYLNAIRWYISGDTSYADNAVKILNAWAAAVNQIPTGPAPDVYGLEAIPIQDFALAAEVLRIYPGWAPANITAFKNMFTHYFYPAVNEFLTNHNGACISYYWANWDAANIGALIAMGVFNDNTAWFNQGVDYYESGAGNGAIMNAVYFVWPGNLGQWNEAGRDQEHDQLGVGLLGYAAQTAWNQGVDLFSFAGNRLLAGAEYTARYNSDRPVPYKTYNNCVNVQQYWVSTNGRGRLDDRPVWELIYNHYNVLQGLSSPNSKAMAELMRPEHGSIDHFGYGTLTFTLSASASPYPPAPIPPAPTGVTATAGVGLVYVGWSQAPTANGFNVLRSTNGGAYTNIATLTATTLSKYTDTSVTNGTAYSYEVQAINKSGTSAASAAATATPAASGALPAGWFNADIGTVQTAGSAQYATVSGNTLLVTGQGSGIGGVGGSYLSTNSSTSDSFNFTYRQVTGDFTLTARLASVSGSKLSNTGLMMRATLNSDDQAVAILLGSTGGRIAELGSRSSTGGSMTWTTGNEYTTMPGWFRLQRAGNVFTAFQSSDGVTWFAVGTSTITMPATYYVGLAASSGDTTNNTTETSNFDNVSPTSLIPNGTYVITSVYSGLVIDQPGSSKRNGKVLQQYTRNDGLNQQWTVHNLGNNVITLTNEASGQLLDVMGACEAHGAPFDHWPANGQTNQQWNVISLGGGNFELSSVSSGLALEVAGGVTTVGAKIDQNTYQGSAWQQWTFVAP